ncbi:MAG TPA: omptin family outer membrane protease [Deltaproteobacteria bacterium]|nr:omptin family outer membrane protease [Deltaproteobacteria bacterium]
MKHLFIVLCIALFTVPAASAHAGTEIEFSTGAGYLTGTNTYEIGNVPSELDPWGRYPYFPISRLDFQLGVYYANLDTKITIDKLRITGSVGMNLNKKAGHMRDYDWGVPFWDDDGEEGPGWYVYVWDTGGYLLDIQSASRSDVDAIIWNADIAYQIFSHHHESRVGKGDFIGYLGIGYEHRSFQYECSLIRQVSPSGIPGVEYAGTGNVGLTYDVDYSLPYAELTLCDTTGRLHIEMAFAYSPFVLAKDRDAHLERIPGPIYAEGRCTGQSMKYSAGIRYDITSHLSVALIIDHLYLRTWGEQDNTIYAGTEDGMFWDNEIWTTEERIISRESYFNLNISYRFGLPL